MTVQSTVGGTAVAGTVVGIGSAQTVTRDPVTLPVEAARELARTGASVTLTLLALAVLLIVAGLLIVGIARRHRDAARGGSGRRGDVSPTVSW